MQGILEIMMSVFDSIKGSGSYLVLLIASLYILYRVNAEKNQWYIYYALMSLILVCLNPVLVWVLSTAFPILGTYSTFLMFAPVLMYLPFAMAEIYDKLKDSKQVYLMFTLLIAVIGISGNLYGFYRNEEVLVYGEKQEAVVEIIKEEQPVMVLADESILPFLRTKTPDTPLLYGRDLYQPGMDLGIVDVYSEELLHLYEAMKNPKDTIGDILAMADLYGCDMVVVKNFEAAPESRGHFTQIADTGEYIVYSVD